MKNKVICIECKNLYLHGDREFSYEHCNVTKKIVFCPITGNKTIKEHGELCSFKNKNGDCKDFIYRSKYLNYLKYPFTYFIIFITIFCFLIFLILFVPC